MLRNHNKPAEIANRFDIRTDQNKGKEIIEETEVATSLPERCRRCGWLWLAGEAEAEEEEAWASASSSMTGTRSSRSSSLFPIGLVDFSSPIPQLLPAEAASTQVAKRLHGGRAFWNVRLMLLEPPNRKQAIG